MKIGFLFNHDQIHQVAHSLPIALALLPDAKVVIATSSETLSAEVRHLATAMGYPGLQPVQLALSSKLSVGLERMFGGVLPARKLLLYGDNLDFFCGLDALVVTERTSLVLKSRYGLTELPIILADHGAGDRAIGFGRETGRFDYILAAGTKIRDRLTAEAHVSPDRIAITGYPKFDLPRPAVLNLNFAGNGRPTVLYNPHVSPHLSSWYPQGRQVLEHFYRSERYNLIFAPHVMLFRRRWVVSIDKVRVARPGSIDGRYHRAPHIHVDLGTRASTDMSYTEAADIYLGDVSSQIYEFLRRPRPAVFINAHRVDYSGDLNYAHWAAGPVIERVGELGDALERAAIQHRSLYEAEQRRLFDYTFSVSHEPAAFRAARAIRSFLSERKDKGALAGLPLA